MELSAKDFARLLQHMEEDKPNKLAQDALLRGREILSKLGIPRYNLNLTKEKHGLD